MESDIEPVNKKFGKISEILVFLQNLSDNFFAKHWKNLAPSVSLGVLSKFDMDYTNLPVLHSSCVSMNEQSYFCQIQNKCPLKGNTKKIIHSIFTEEAENIRDALFYHGEGYLKT